MEFPFLRESEIEGAAQKLLVAVFGRPWRERQPVDLDAIVYDHLTETENLVFDDEADLPPEGGEFVLGKTLPRTGRILLNRTLKRDPEPGRGRFTLAHELGHWVLHRPLFIPPPGTLDLFGGSDVNEPEFEFVGLNRGVFPGSCRPTAVAREEWQANRFAVALLIDADVLREEFEDRFGAPPVVRAAPTWRYKARSARDLAQLLARGTTDHHPPLREVFGLSVEAMAIALESRGYVVEEAPLL